VLRDTAGVCGLELCRRIIGLAHVKDITSLVGEMRVRAERICLIGAKDFILRRDQYVCGADFLETMKIAMAGYGVNVHE
jgi:5-methylthioribose kinase